MISASSFAHSFYVLLLGFRASCAEMNEGWGASLLAALVIIGPGYSSEVSGCMDSCFGQERKKTKTE